LNAVAKFALISANSLNRRDTGGYVMLANSHKVVFPYKNESKENKHLTAKHITQAFSRASHAGSRSRY